MNAQLEFLRAKASPLALSTAIALALAFSATAQAQYTYPGTASGSEQSAKIHPARAGAPTRGGPQQPSDAGSYPCGGPGAECSNNGGGMNGSGGSGPAKRNTSAYNKVPHQANGIQPMRAGARQRAEYGRAPAANGGGNPSMQKGEACPPGSMCATPVPAHGSGGAGSGHVTGGYGAHESYGATAVQSSEAAAARPVAAGGRASVSPVQAGHGALNYGPSQNSNANFRNSVTGKSSGPSTNVTGQRTSFTGPNGKQVNMGGSQTITGPNGQKQTIGGGPDLNNLGGGYGHQKGSGIKQGMSYSSDGNGSISGTRTGSAPGMASASGMNINNGGASGVSEQAGAPDSFGEWVHRKAADSDPNVVSTTSSDNGTLTWHGDQKWSGKDDDGLTWDNGRPMDGPDGHGGTYQNGHDIKLVNNQDSADMGATAGPGEIVSGTGQVVHPGQKKGQDTGGGQTDDGTSHGGGQNAQGQYIAPSGQDNVKKPKEVGVLKMDYNGKNGAIDPKLNGSNGGG